MALAVKNKNYAVKKNVSAIHMSANFTLLQRKLVNALLFNAADTLLTRDSHTINVQLLSAFIGFDSKNVGYLKNSLKGMVETAVEWDILEEDGSKTWEVMSLLSWAKINKGVCTYSFAKPLTEKLHHPDMYAKIQLSIMREMSSSYSLILYENCYRFLKVGTTGLWPLETFRKMMFVQDNPTYNQFKFLNRDVIKPAIKEVNKLSNIVIEMHTEKTGRSITGLRFTVKPNPQLSLVGMEDEDDITETDVYKQLLDMNVQKPLARSWVIEYGEEYCREKIALAKHQSAAGKIKSSKVGFLKSAIEHDYKSDAVEKNKNMAAARETRLQKEAAQQRFSRDQEKWRSVTKLHRKDCARKIWEAHKALSSEEQSKMEASFVKTLDKDYYKSDFKKKKWDAVFMFADAKAFWEKKGLSFPTLYETAKREGIENPEAFETSLSEREGQLA